MDVFHMTISRRLILAMFAVTFAMIAIFGIAVRQQLISNLVPDSGATDRPAPAARGDAFEDDDAPRRLASIDRLLITTAAAILAIALLLIAGIVVRLTRPVRSLAAAIRDRANLDPILAPPGSDTHLSSIASAFNHLAETLRANSESLNRQQVTDVRRTADRVRQELDASPTSMTIVDAQGKIVHVNASFASLFNYAPPELLGQSIETLVPADLKTRHALSRQAYQADPSTRPMSDRRSLFGVRKDGTEFPVDIGLTPIEFDGAPAVIGAISDVTERHRAERLMHYFNSVIQSTEDGIIAVDMRGTVTHWNIGAERLFGYAAGEMIGQRVEILAPAAEADVGRSILHRVLHGETIRHFETKRKRKDGVFVDIDLTLAPIQDSAGRLVGASAIARDITEQKRTAGALAKSAEALRNSNQSLIQYLNVAASRRFDDASSEERSFSKLLADVFGESVPDDARADIDRVLENTQRLAGLVDDVLEYARAGRHTSQRESIDTEALVNEVIQTIAPPDNVHVRIEGDLPVVLYDESQLRQVFEQLISNAVCHMGKPVGDVVISCKQLGKMAQFSVRDTGVGIPEEHVNRIFGLFQKVDAPTNRTSTGIGLSIVVRIVERNGGRVQVLSRRGAGAEFIFTVPGADAVGKVATIPEAHTQ